jgi:hypothetical protein
VITTTSAGGAGGAAGAAGQGGSFGWSEVKNGNGYIVCRRDGRNGRSGQRGGASGRSGSPGPRAVFTTIASPFPQGVASVGVRAASTTTDLSVQGPRVKPSGVTANGGVTVNVNVSAHVTFGKPKAGAPTAAALFAQLKGPNVLRIENKSAIQICEVFPLDKGTKLPVTLNAIASALPANQGRDLGRWAPPKGVPASTLIGIGVRSCDGRLEGIASVPMNESTTILVSATAIANPPPHTAVAMLGKVRE